MRIVEGEAIRANRRLFRRNFVLHLSSQLSHLRCVNVALCAAGSDPARALCYSICRREFAVNSQYIFAVYFRSIFSQYIFAVYFRSIFSQYIEDWDIEDWAITNSISDWLGA